MTNGVIQPPPLTPTRHSPFSPYLYYVDSTFITEFRLTPSLILFGTEDRESDNIPVAYTQRNSDTVVGSDDEPIRKNSPQQTLLSTNDSPRWTDTISPQPQLSNHEVIECRSLDGQEQPIKTLLTAPNPTNSPVTRTVQHNCDSSNLTDSYIGHTPELVATAGYIHPTQNEYNGGYTDVYLQVSKDTQQPISPLSLDSAAEINSSTTADMHVDDNNEGTLARVYRLICTYVKKHKRSWLIVAAAFGVGYFVGNMFGSSGARRFNDGLPRHLVWVKVYGFQGWQVYGFDGLEATAATLGHQHWSPQTE